MNPVTWREFTRRILVIYAGPAHATRTARKMRATLHLVAALTGINTLDQLDTELAARFVAGRAETVRANTLRADLSYLAAAAQIALEEGWLQRVPRWKRVRPRPSPIVPPRVHPIADVARVLELLQSRSATWSGARLFALAATAAYTGLRRDELLWLQTEDVDLTTSLLRVQDRRRLKTLASAATVPIPPELAQICAAWLPQCGSKWLFPGLRKRDRPWIGGANGERPCDRLRQTAEELGIPGFTLASLRHTFATWARRRWGLSGIQLMDVLRHTSPRTQAWYVHDEPDPTALVRSVQAVSYRA